jgi:hypothetical protein
MWSPKARNPRTYPQEDLPFLASSALGKEKDKSEWEAVSLLIWQITAVAGGRKDTDQLAVR